MIVTSKITNSQLPRMHSRDMLCHAVVLYTRVDAQRDKLALIVATDNTCGGQRAVAKCLQVLSLGNTYRQ